MCKEVFSPKITNKFVKDIKLLLLFFQIPSLWNSIYMYMYVRELIVYTANYFLLTAYCLLSWHTGVDPELERGRGGGGDLGKTCTSMFGYVINVYICIHIQLKQNIRRLLLLSNFFCFLFVCLSYYRYSFLVLKIQRGGAAIPVTFLLDQPMFHKNVCL